MDGTKSLRQPTPGSKKHRPAIEYMHSHNGLIEKLISMSYKTVNTQKLKVLGLYTHASMISKVQSLYFLVYTTSTKLNLVGVSGLNME